MLHASVAGTIPSKYDIRHGQDPVAGYGREDLGSGGASPDGKYSWKRNGAEVLVMVPVADDVETKDVSYVFQEAYVCIAVCGATLLAGRPGCDVEAEECYWEFSSDSGQRCLCVHLQKKGSLSARWPDALFLGTT